MVSPRGRALLSLLLASALVGSVAAAAVGGAAGTGAASTGTPAVDAPSTLQGFDADRTSFRITVYENGSAEWRFRYEKGLNESEREDFEAFAEEFNNNETELYSNFRTRARWLTDNGSTATGREMSAEGFDRDARTEGLDPNSQTLGVVEMSFRWEGFARLNDGRVEAGDVFEGGLYIGPNQELVFAAGPNLAFVEALPADNDRVLSGGSLAESDAVTWSGEKSFNDGRPRVVLADEAGTAPTTATPTRSPTTTETPAGAAPSWLLPVGVLLAVVLLGGGAAIAYRGGALPPGDDGAAAATTGSDDGGAAAGTDDAEPAVGVTEEELLSDEERVVNLLESHGGRMKQVDIVEETDWSKSKVSMLLSEMEDEGEISKLRVGRENIVSLSGHEPDAAGSPFDDEE